MHQKCREPKVKVLKRFQLHHPAVHYDSALQFASQLAVHCNFCTLAQRALPRSSMQENAVISALALILGKVRLGIKVSGSQSNCWKNKCTANTLEPSKEGRLLENKQTDKQTNKHNPSQTHWKQARKQGRKLVGKPQKLLVQLQPVRHKVPLRSPWTKQIVNCFFAKIPHFPNKF